MIELKNFNEQLAYIHNQSRITNAKNMIVLYPYAEMKAELKSFLMSRKIPILSAEQLKQKIPGIYIGEEGIGVRIEDDVLITKDGCEVLTKGMIKEVSEIEAFMN